MPKPAAAPYTATSLTLELPEGTRPIGDWRNPKAEVNPLGPESGVYTGEVRFSHVIEVAPSLRGEQKIGVVVTYQACNERQGTQPVRKTMLVPLRAA